MHPFYGVLGKPFFDLTPFISTDGLDEVVEELAQLYARKGPFQKVVFDEGQELLPEKLSAEVLGFEPMTKPRELQGATHAQRMAYTSFFEPVLPLENFVHLRNLGNDTGIAPFAPLTMEWTRRLPIDLTRVTVYFSSPGQYMGPHRDSPTYMGYNAPLIYINPLLKPFYVIGPTGERHIVDTKIAHFNNQDFHGMEQNNFRSCLSIRCGGYWHDDLLDATGLREHFKGLP